MNKLFLFFASFVGTAIVMTAISARSEFQPVGEAPRAEKKPRDIQTRIETLKERLAAAEGEINGANQNKSCEGDSQCEALEMGARHCGGPSRYIVVSNANPKLKTIKAKINEYTRAETELNNIDAPLFCTDSPKLPSALCKQGKCQ